MKKVNLSILGSYNKKIEFLINYVYNLAISKGIDLSETNSSLLDVIEILIKDKKLKEFPILLVIKVIYFFRFYHSYLLSNNIVSTPIFSNFNAFVIKYGLDISDSTLDNTAVSDYAIMAIYNDVEFKESGYNFSLLNGDIRILFDSTLGFGVISFNIQKYDPTYDRFKHIVTLFVEPILNQNNKITIILDLHEFEKKNIVLNFKYEDLSIDKLKNLLSDIVFKILNDEYMGLVNRYFRFEMDTKKHIK